MPGWLITAILFGVLAVVALFVRRSFKRTALKLEAAAEKRRTDETSGSSPYGGSGRSLSSYEDTSTTKKAKEARSVAHYVGFLALALALFAAFSLIMASTVVVSTKNVGVVTTFGKPSGTLDNGVHAIMPWQKVTELDGAIQTDSHAGTDPKDATPCTTVRIAHQSTACVDNSIRWRIRGGSADRLFRDYKDFANIRDSLVTRELGAALNTVFKDFDPLATDANGNTISPSQDVLSGAVTKLLQGEIGDDIEVLNVIIPLQHLDDATQNRLNALQAEVANTRIANQRKLTATADAAANKELSASVSNDPNVLVSKCFDNLAEMIKKNQPVPAGFSCWPGGSSAIVVPSTK